MERIDMGVDPTIVVAGVTGFFGLAGGIASGIVANRQTRQRVDEVHGQVKNSHKTNLRDDIDSVLDGLRDLRSDFADMRGELYQERHERVELGYRVDRVERHLRAE
jgi:hypothetical protein